ncbi:polyprenyl synthetase family protein [Thermosphaera chiliense]|uniref:Polyprenyl synthetase family protein n=1 Tax=Thermosphaera chiliense TaxID=3402707 RepID=A0A7M1UUX2_9CREN|nr:polyprenyl synthetase family protein [Thermosphaera aggregans]QOR94924.1 polyprenyl synthetase family protein [Thermosphaera aggregans]
MEEFSNLLNYSVKLVESRLSEVFNELEREAGGVSPHLNNIPFIARDYTLRGGKRIRAFLALVGYWSRTWGSGDVETISKLMAALELLQSYLLVHDDIMDMDELRRGGPTVHAWFRDECLKACTSSNCTHYGVSQAITVGDYLEATAVENLAMLKLPSEAFVKLITTYSKGLRMVAYGQYLDVLYSNLPLARVGENDILLVHKLKTASYTVELPLHLGAIASLKYTDRLLNELSSYAMPAGIAFQLRDDIIGLFGDPRTTGKPSGSDVKGKKKTLLIIKAYELSSSSDKEFLEEVYDELPSERITEEHVERVREIVKSTGSLDYNLKLIDELVSQALREVEKAVEVNREAKEVLTWLLNKLAYREK